MRTVLLLIFLAACNCGPLHYSKREVNAHTFASAVLLTAECMEGGKVYGTGFAVSPMHVITARHVVTACESVGMVTWKITGRMYNGREVEFALDMMKPGVDAARLVAVGTNEVFGEWLTLGPDPEPGDELCNAALDSNTMAFTFLCGWASGYYEGYLALNMHGVPGHSGSAVVDRQGRVVGILVMGNWDPSRPWIVLLEPVERWKDLLPPYFASDLMD